MPSSRGQANAGGHQNFAAYIKATKVEGDWLPVNAGKVIKIKLKKLMKNIIKSLVVVFAVAAVAGVATYSYFSDTETSTGNTFTAGTLDLTLNGNNGTNTLFASQTIKPGDQPVRKYTLKNEGNVAGFVDIENISVVNNENVRTEPEIEAGDTTDNVGELGAVLNVRMYFDNDKDGYFSTGDEMFYNGKVNGLPTNFELDEPIAAGGGIEVVTDVYDWWNTSNDNQAQSDSLEINATFELAQTAGQ